MTAKRKQITMVVKVSVPKDVTARQARREVRELITHCCPYHCDEGDVVVRSVTPFYGRVLSNVLARGGR